MKHMTTILVAVLAATVLTGCLSPKGDSIGKQKANAGKMSVKGLDMFYKENPTLKTKIAKAAGYGVYKNIGVQIFVPSTESGWGIVHNNLTGKDTYMKFFSIGLGLGLGVRDFRGILVFDNQENIKDFINSGWGFSGQANAVFKSGETGGGVSAAHEVMPGVTLYKINVNGFALQATLQGAKNWENDYLNEKKK